MYATVVTGGGCMKVVHKMDGATDRQMTVLQHAVSDQKTVNTSMSVVSCADCAWELIAEWELESSHRLLHVQLSHYLCYGHSLILGRN